MEMEHRAARPSSPPSERRPVRSTPPSTRPSMTARVARPSRADPTTSTSSPWARPSSVATAAMMLRDEITRPWTAILVQTAYAFGAGHGQRTVPWLGPPIEEGRMPLIAQDDELGAGVALAQRAERRHRRKEVPGP